MNNYMTSTWFRLPWTTFNNPNGWIEPTTFCQLKCPGCYRGCDKGNHHPVHIPLEEVLRQVDFLIEKRNIHTLSISGGDPLLYPDLLELVAYAHSQGLRTMIFTNGINLDEERLIELKIHGATQIIIHIDRFQGRTEFDSMNALNELRKQYCELFRRVGGVNLGFIQPLTIKCLEDIPLMNRFFSQNRDIINLVVYTLYREICWDKKQRPDIDTSITVGDVLIALEKDDFFEPASYLPGTINKSEPAWTFSYSVGEKKKILGFLDGQVYELLQSRYYRRNKRYFFISSSNRVGKWGLLKLSGYSSVRDIVMRGILSFLFFSKLYFQTCLVIRGPQKSGKEWDLCDGCPDSMIYKGQFKPSCILEEVKNEIQFSNVELIHHEL